MSAVHDPPRQQQGDDGARHGRHYRQRRQAGLHLQDSRAQRKADQRHPHSLASLLRYYANDNGGRPSSLPPFDAAQ
jgi:hypothetical protein